jgi:cellulose biosynthesis protein BcsQ
VRIVSFFNHKGGVGKTTILFNAALALAQRGKRVLIADLDAQANVTALSLNEDAYSHVLEEGRTVYHALNPLISGAGDAKPFQAVELRSERVYLLPGDIRLANFEAIVPNGWTDTLAGRARGFRVTSAVYRLIHAYDDLCEIALVDLGPNVGDLNRTALIGSDGFVIPLTPDLFSAQALPSVGNSVRSWVTEWATAVKVRRESIDFKVPDGRPVPLGYITQQFSMYRSEPSAAFGAWLHRIPEIYREGLLKPLEEVGINVPDGEDHLGSIPNLYSLVPKAQEANKAIFELSGSEARGGHNVKAKSTEQIFSGIVDKLLGRLEIET